MFILAHWNLGGREDLFTTHLIIIIKSELSIFPIVVIFFRGCVPKAGVRYVVGVIYKPAKAAFCIFYYSAVLWYAQMIGYIMSRWSRSFVCYMTPLWSSCRRIWKYWTSKMDARCILQSVCLRWSQFSQLFSCNIWDCVKSAYPCLLWWLWEYVYFILLLSSNRKYDPFAIVRG